jgi:hypothetical protein
MTVAGVPFSDLWSETITGAPLPDSATSFTTTALQLASQLLWANSGRRFGTSTLTVRPCTKHHSGWFDYMSWPWITSFLSDIAWSMWPGAWLLPLPLCGDGESIPPLHQIDLVKTPIASVNTVTVDGDVLDSSAYRVDNWQYLVRIDGGEWPWSQNLNLDDTNPGTWSINYTFGEAVPLAGQLACGEFAREIALYLAGDKSCKLPQRTTSTTRQGVTQQMIPIDDLLKLGHTGLFLTDSFIIAFNRNGRTSRGRIYRADAPKRTRVVNT